MVWQINPSGEIHDCGDSLKPAEQSKFRRQELCRGLFRAFVQAPLLSHAMYYTLGNVAGGRITPHGTLLAAWGWNIVLVN